MRTSTLILSLFLLSSNLIYAQSGSDSSAIAKVEKAVRSRKVLLETSRILGQLEQKALKTKDANMLSRVWSNKIEIRDLRSEDSLFFKNSALIDSALHQRKSSTRLKVVLHLMQAKRLSSFNYRYLKFKRDRYETPNLANNYAAFNKQQLDSVVDYHFNQALLLNKVQSKEQKEDWGWLLSNPRDLTLFDYSIRDVIYVERVNHQMKVYRNFQRGAEDWINWFDLPSENLTLKLDSLSGEKEVQPTFLLSYRNWQKDYAKQGDKAEFIEALLRRQIFHYNNFDSVSRARSITYLETKLSSTNNQVKAYSIYQLMALWNAESKNYSRTYRKDYQFLPVKVLDLFEANKDLLGQYKQLNKEMLALKKDILNKSITLKLDREFIPSDPILLHVSYKNTPKMFYRIVKISLVEYEKQSRPLAAGKLLDKPFLREGSFDLPLPEDHNQHATFAKLDGLESGHYHLLFSDEPIDQAAEGLSAVSFTVSKFAAINDDERVYVLNRKTGFPQADAGVQAIYFKRDEKGRLTSNAEVVQQLKVNSLGYVVVNKTGVDRLLITHQEDTLSYEFKFRKDQLPRGQNYKGGAGLEGFYQDNARMYIYSDRGIYRPGQTVHFKAILLSKNPVSGQQVVYRPQEIYPALLTLMDPFNRKIDSLKFTVNEYGSFSGSFVLPKSSATGEWRIGSGISRADYAINGGRFNVEEYKRPSYELQIEQPKKTLMLGDPFSWKVTAKSFSGVNLNGIPVHYSVYRSGQAPGIHDPMRPSPYENVKVLDTTVYANEKGEIEIQLIDSVLKQRKHTGNRTWAYTYQLKAEATESTGEKAEGAASVYVSTQPYTIGISINQVYDRKTLSEIPVSVYSRQEGKVGQKVRIHLYRTDNRLVNPQYRTERTDQNLYSEEQLLAWFPQLKSKSAPVSSRELIDQIILNTGDMEKYKLPKDMLVSGNYELVAEVISETADGAILGQSKRFFNVFDSEERTVPDADFKFVTNNQVSPGDQLVFYTSTEEESYSIYELQYFSRDESGLQVKRSYAQMRQGKGLQDFTLKVPVDAVERLLLSKVYVNGNRIFKKEETLYIVQKKEEQPEIVIERYRRIIAPGAKETFSISIKSKKQEVVAELMTTLYDASLDKLKGHQWNIPVSAGSYGYLYSNWSYQLTRSQEESLSYSWGKILADDVVIQSSVGNSPRQMTLDLNETVVVGYGAQAKQDLVGAIAPISIRGSASLEGYRDALFVVDGKVVEGGIGSISAESIREIKVLKGAEAVALYGSRAAQGVVIVNTRNGLHQNGEIDPIVKIRKDFNETAFFFPKIYADKDGRYTFSFTMPETATSWNWKMLAHTKSALFAYAERELTTQLSLMVQPNMPRLLYQGDEIKLQSRISNLDTLLQQGKVRIRIEDIVTGKDLTAQLVGQAENRFSVGKKLSTNTAFLLKVPKDQSNPLKVVVSAISGSFSDAEEHIIPVLSTRVFVRNHQALNWTKGTDTVLQTPSLPADAELYGLSLSINPRPQAALINSLPWLANYSFDCAEQAFNKLFAQATALKIMQTDSLVQKSWKQRVLAQQKATEAGRDDTSRKSAE